MTEDEIYQVWKQYNRGQSIKQLAARHGMEMKQIKQMLSEHLDRLIIKYRTMDDQDKVEHNEIQREILRIDIGTISPEICSHGKYDYTRDGLKYCRYCGAKLR